MGPFPVFKSSVALGDHRLEHSGFSLNSIDVQWIGSPSSANRVVFLREGELERERVAVHGASLGGAGVGNHRDLASKLDGACTIVVTTVVAHGLVPASSHRHGTAADRGVLLIVRLGGGGGDARSFDAFIGRDIKWISKHASLSGTIPIGCSGHSGNEQLLSMVDEHLLASDGHVLAGQDGDFLTGITFQTVREGSSAIRKQYLHIAGCQEVLDVDVAAEEIFLVRIGTGDRWCLSRFHRDDQLIGPERLVVIPGPDVLESDHALRFGAAVGGLGETHLQRAAVDGPILRLDGHIIPEQDGFESRIAIRLLRAGRVEFELDVHTPLPCQFKLDARAGCLFDHRVHRNSGGGLLPIDLHVHHPGKW